MPKTKIQDKSGNEADFIDTTNNAIKINVVAGGAGDGAILDGANSSIKATVFDYTNSNPIAVRLTDTDGNYVGAGAGTQYADGATRGSAIGTLAMGDDGTNIQSLKCDSNGVLAIQDNGSSITIDGSVSLAAAIPAGNNNIGDVDVLTLPAIPAGTNLIGKVSSGEDTSTIYNGTTALTPKFAAIAAATYR